MSSAERENFIASSMFIPNWVKSKFDNSGFDPSALSPPTHDSEFFYVKFPKTEKAKPAQFDNLSDKVIKLKEENANQQINPVAQDSVKPRIIKAMGVEDGFKGERSGTSVFAVAQQMIAGSKPPVRGFTTDDAPPSSSYLQQRRNSKSLPASPLTSPEPSPRTRRKNVTAFALQNRFTSSSVAATSVPEADDKTKREKSSWILSGLFSTSRDRGLGEKNKMNAVAAEGRNESSNNEAKNVNVTLEVTQAKEAPPLLDKKLYLKKRSEIRELNFMSPISM